eukprot:NODE_361_length_10144_cov_0.288402.p2 type:complete len:868 gc:universal NODE_361_length_10144_cov_0.288402:9379-6776(-)
MSIIFQQIEAEETQRDELELTFYGRTEDGKSVCCHVFGYKPYLYCSYKNINIQSFNDYVNKITGSTCTISKVHKKILLYYNENGKDMFKISSDTPAQIKKLQRELTSPTSNGQENGSFGSFEVYDADVLNIGLLKAMVDFDISGMNWLEIPANKYTTRSGNSKVSNCDIEIDTGIYDIISHDSNGEYSKLAPLKIFSFDIECSGRKGIFPEPQHDAVIQIACVLSSQGSEATEKVVFTLKSCAPISGAIVHSFQTESQLLLQFSKYFVKSDPDVITGYNILNFDLLYLIDRAKTLKVLDFPYFGRLRNKETKAKNTRFSSKAFGTRDSKEFNIDGRIIVDMLQVIQRDFKLRSYSLNAVSAEFIGDQKEDVHHSIITELQNGNDDTRRRLAVYCIKDAELPLLLMRKLMTLINYIEMARVCGVPFNFLLSRGQQIKVLSQLFRKAKETNYVIQSRKGEGASYDDSYEGATVLEPKKGYYDIPIATLDFSSLYPSIMMAHNLCYTTLLDKQTIERNNFVKDVHYTLSPTGDCFVKKDICEGLLPLILADLLGARKQAKSDLKKETNEFKKAVLNGRQLALKLSANSVYGFTGATIGSLPCLEVSASVTAFGRDMIEQTKCLVESKYNKKNGYEHDSLVIYGDTDSVMVRFGPTDMHKVMEMGLEAAKYVTKNFVKPINLEFEKVYYPYLLMNKKRYAGLNWTRPDKYDKMDAKGIETVRRDNCQLVSKVIETCLDLILIKADPNGAVEYAKSMISDLLQNKVDMSLLVITKQLSKEEYENKQPHVECAKKMKLRDAGSAPNLGDRVAYVIVKGAKGAKTYEKSEDPIYVLDNNISIDTQYYLENQLSKPLLRLFEPILKGNCENILCI